MSKKLNEKIASIDFGYAENHYIEVRSPRMKFNYRNSEIFVKLETGYDGADLWSHVCISCDGNYIDLSEIAHSDFLYSVANSPLHLMNTPEFKEEVLAIIDCYKNDFLFGENNLCHAA